MVTREENIQLLPTVFLDRDGVINVSDVIDGKPYAPRKLENFILLEGVVEAVGELKKAGYLVIVVTNQPDVGNGLVDKDIVEKMHIKLKRSMPIDDICVCYHAQLEGCNCRKPKPGMILQSANKYKIDLSESFIIGDRCSDIDAGKSAGCKTVFIDRHYKEAVPEAPDMRCESLPDAVKLILNQNIMN